jgi:hypothetical protein
MTLYVIYSPVYRHHIQLKYSVTIATVREDVGCTWYLRDVFCSVLSIWGPMHRSPETTCCWDWWRLIWWVCPFFGFRCIRCGSSISCIYSCLWSLLALVKLEVTFLWLVGRYVGFFVVARWLCLVETCSLYVLTSIYVILDGLIIYYIVLTTQQNGTYENKVTNLVTLVNIIWYNVEKNFKCQRMSILGYIILINIQNSFHLSVGTTVLLVCNLLHAWHSHNVLLCNQRAPWFTTRAVLTKTFVSKPSPFYTSPRITEMEWELVTSQNRPMDQNQ